MERVLVPAELPRLLRAVHAALVDRREEVDALNVFPVPDGDTGSNLAATAEAVVRAIGDTPPDGSQLTRAALRSARGNSGVIFSQLVRAVVEAIEDPTSTSDVATLAAALSRADLLSRDAVADPVEGTILTAMRAAAAVAVAANEAGRTDLGGVLDEVRAAVADAVLATQDQLDVLRDAGVVDAGARGFEVVVVAIQSVVTGDDVQLEALANVVPRCVPGAELALDANPIEVQFVLAGDDEAAARLRSALGDLGDSVVVVAADGLVQAHVHTNEPEAALAVGRDVGEIEGVRVTDLRPPPLDQHTLPVVAVLPAGGLSDLGAGSGAAIVAGAAGALPSVDDLLLAAKSTGSDRVLLLPGHPNVVPTARQAAAVARDSGTTVIEVAASATHPLVVLSCLTLQSTDLAEVESMAAAARAGEVVLAVRDATLDVGEVRRGDPMATVDGRVVAAGRDVTEMLQVLLGHLDAASGELVTIAVGADCELDAGDVMLAALPSIGDAEVDVIDGGQRPAVLLVAVES